MIALAEEASSQESVPRSRNPWEEAFRMELPRNRIRIEPVCRVLTTKFRTGRSTFSMKIVKVVASAGKEL